MTLSNFVPEPVKLLLLKTPVKNDCSVLPTFTPGKEIGSFFSSSAVNLRDECCLFKKFKNNGALSIDLKSMNVSSTHHLQNAGLKVLER